MDQPIVIQDLDEAAADWIRQEAQRRGISEQAVAVELIQGGLRAAREGRPSVPYHDLDWFFGSWTDEEADEFLKVIEDFELIEAT